MLLRTFTNAGILGLALLLGIWGAPDVLAQSQGQRGQQPPPRQNGQFGQRGQQQPQQQSQQQPQPEESTPFIHGVYVGIGVGSYQGDVDENPTSEPMRFLGQAKPRIEVGIDHRRGEYDQFGFGARLSFDPIDGAADGWGGGPSLQFSANTLNLDFTADYELPYVDQGFMRVFLGGGPSLIINPSYEGFPSNDRLSEENQDLFRPELGTRVTASLVWGISIYDYVRIGFRTYPSDYVDGYGGYTNSDQDIWDFVGFISVGYRFDLKY